MNSCCMYDVSPSVHREDWVKARKQHKCCECGDTIEIGSDYELVVQLWDGQWYRYKTCEPCADLRESLAEVDCPYYEGLADCFQNWLSDGPHTVMSVKAGTHAAKLVPSYYLEES